MEGKELKDPKPCCPPGTEGCKVPPGKACCKCGPGWSCVITKIEGPHDGKPFYNCSEGCVCVTEDSKSKTTIVQTPGAYCECGEGYMCTITKIEGPDAGKVYFECGNGCKCEIPDGTPVTAETSTTS